MLVGFFLFISVLPVCLLLGSCLEVLVRRDGAVRKSEV